MKNLQYKGFEWKLVKREPDGEWAYIKKIVEGKPVRGRPTKARVSEITWPDEDEVQLELEVAVPEGEDTPEQLAVNTEDEKETAVED